LREVLIRFIEDAQKAKKQNQAIKEKIENNIFGFDIDENAVKKCISMLDNIAQKYGLKNIKWNILKTDSLDKSFVSSFLIPLILLLVIHHILGFSTLVQKEEKKFRTSGSCVKKAQPIFL